MCSSDLPTRPAPRAGALWIFGAALLTACGFLFSGFVASRFPVEFRAEASFVRTFRLQDGPLLVTSSHDVAEDLLRPELWPAIQQGNGGAVQESTEALRRRLTVRREAVQPTSDRIFVGLSHCRPEIARREVERLVRAHVERCRRTPEQQRIALRLQSAERDRRTAGVAWTLEQQRLSELSRGRQAARTAQTPDVHLVFKPENVQTQSQLQGELDRGRRRLSELIELYTAQHPTVAQLQRELADLERRCAQAAAAAGTLQKQADRARTEQAVALEQYALREQNSREAVARRALQQASHEVDVLTASMQEIERSRTIRCELGDDPPRPAAPCGLWRRRAAFLLGCAASGAFGLSLLRRRSGS